MNVRLSTSVFIVSFVGVAFPLSSSAAASLVHVSARSAIVSLQNSDRAKQGLKTFMEDAILDRAAQDKANDMVNRNYFSHVSPDGVDPWYWFKKAGYTYSKAGENLAQGFSRASDIEYAWLQSPLHRANVLSAAFTRVGIGISHGFYMGHETTFTTEFFATPRQTAMTVITSSSMLI